MRNHIAFKFIAVVLCAAALLGALGSAGAILALTQADLFNKTVDQVREERFRNDAENYAWTLAMRSASADLGHCPEALVSQRYTANWFAENYDANYYGYAVYDETGALVDSYVPANLGDPAYTFSFTPTGQYMYLVSETPQEQETTPAPEEDDAYLPAVVGVDYAIYDAIPADGTTIGEVVYSTDQGSTGASSGNFSLGLLYRSADGAVIFRSDSVADMDDVETPILGITFYDLDGTLVYQAAHPAGVGSFRVDADGSFVYRSMDTFFLTSLGEVTSMTLLDENGEAIQNISGSPSIGTLMMDGEGYLIFQATFAESYDEKTVSVTGVEFLGQDGQVLYEAQDPAGVGTMDHSDDGHVIYISNYPITLAAQPAAVEPAQEIVQETTVPEEPTVEQTEAASVEEDGDAEEASEVYTEEPDEDGEGEHSAASDVPQEDPDQTAEETAAEETAAPEPPATEAPTVPVTVPETAPAAITVTEPAATEPLLINGKALTEYSINRTHYYADDGTWMDVEYVYVPLPSYTVEVSFAAKASRYESVYTVLQLIRAFRSDLFLTLGVSALLFAVLAVYLCCAAGRHPKREEVHAGGLNCLPLDLYLGLTIGGITAIVVMGVKGTDYLLRQNAQTGCAYAIAAGYAGCLLLVGFCFACVAQFKTPGGYWWRSSLCGRFIQLFFRLSVWLDRTLRTRFSPFLARLLKGLWKLVRTLFTWLWRQWQRLANWILYKTHRILSILPLVWQWLLMGFGIVLLAAVLAPSGPLGMLLTIALCVGLVVYGAVCFGRLLESTRRMSKGDLSTKVDDKHMVGAFKDFAQDLNALADVAVVAAQKQLKSERMKTELITNVSHDIKTPLTSIISYVDLLQKPHTDEEQEQYLEVLARQSLRLKKLIDDLMEMSKASTGNMAVDIARLDAVESVNQALGEFADKLDKAQLTPVFRHSEESVAMLADGRLVWRVMSNLLSNAVKYAMPGTRLYIDLMRLEGKVVISMKNISRDELNIDADELMERFVRGDDARNTEGSGLGLNIAKSLMELQKGQLQLLVDGDLFKVTLVFPGES